MIQNSFQFASPVFANLVNFLGKNVSDLKAVYLQPPVNYSFYYKEEYNRPYFCDSTQFLRKVGHLTSFNYQFRNFNASATFETFDAFREVVEKNVTLIEQLLYVVGTIMDCTDDETIRVEDVNFISGKYNSTEPSISKVHLFYNRKTLRKKKIRINLFFQETRRWITGFLIREDNLKQVINDKQIVLGYKKKNRPVYNSNKNEYGRKKYYSISTINREI